MAEYQIQKGDTLSQIALDFYGDIKADDLLAKFNHIPDKNYIRAGDTIYLPSHLIYYKNITERKENSGVVLGGCARCRFPLTIYETIAGKERVASRRFVYCWYKSPELGWQDLGILLTDDWGQPHHLASIVKTHFINTTVDVAAATLADENRIVSLPFGFYDASVVNSLPFPPGKGAQLNCTANQEILFKPKDNISGAPVTFCPGDEVAFMFAPLDTIRATDEPMEDNRGFAKPPGYQTQKKINIYDLENMGKLVRLVLPEAKKHPAHAVKQGVTFECSSVTIHVTVPMILTEYISLIKQITQFLDVALQWDFAGKKPYTEMAGRLNEVSYILDLMHKHPKGKSKQHWTSEEDAEIIKYKTSIDSFVNFIDETFIKKQVYDVKAIKRPEAGTGVMREIPDLYELMSVNRLVEELIRLFEDEHFNTLFKNYLEELKRLPRELVNVPTAPNQDFFSFKHPYITFADAFQDACLAVSIAPNEQLVEKFYNSQIKPLETACVKAFDDLAPDDELKKSTIDIFKDLRMLIPDQAQRDYIKELLLNLDQASGSKPPESPIQQFWTAVTDVADNQLTKHFCGFWNNQDGTDSMMTRILKAYEGYRNKQIPDNPTLLIQQSVRQVKLYMMQARYITIGQGLHLEQIKQQVVNITLSRTTFHIKQSKRIKINKKATPLINLTASSVQLVMAMVGMVNFFNKEKPAFEDYVGLVDSTAGGALALSGIAPIRWVKYFGMDKFAGRSLASIGFFCTLYFSSMRAAEHDRYGEDFMTTLSILSAMLAFGGCVSWAYGAIMGCAMGGIAGWIVFLGGLIIEGITIIWDKSLPGTENLLLNLLKAIDQNPLLRSPHSQVYTIERQTPKGRIMNTDGSFIPYVTTNYIMDYEVTFPSLFDNRFKMDFKDALLDNSGSSFLYTCKDIWEDLILKRELRFKPLDYSITVDPLVNRGWTKEMLVSLHYDGWLRYEDNDDVEDNVNRLCDEWESIQKDPEELNHKYAKLLGAPK